MRFKSTRYTWFGKFSVAGYPAGNYYMRSKSWVGIGGGDSMALSTQGDSIHSRSGHSVDQDVGYSVSNAGLGLP